MIIGDPAHVEAFYRPLRRYGADLALVQNGIGIYIGTWPGSTANQPPHQRLISVSQYLATSAHPSPSLLGEKKSIFPLNHSTLAPQLKALKSASLEWPRMSRLRAVSWPLIFCLEDNMTSVQHFSFSATFSCRTFTLLGMLVACSSALLILRKIWKYSHSHRVRVLRVACQLDTIIYVPVKRSHYSIVYRSHLETDLEESTKIGCVYEIVVL